MKLINRILVAMGLLLSPICFAQSTTVSVTVQDPSGQTWNNGTISYIFQPNGQFHGQYQWNGANLPSQYLVNTVVNLDNSAHASFSIPSSTAISPSGTSWNFIVCANASFKCITVNLPVTGTSENISTQINAALPSLLVPATAIPRAYTDAEVQLLPFQGGIYFNVTSSLPKYFDGSAWQFFGGGGGGGVTFINGVAGSFTFTGSGVSCTGSTCTFSLGPAQVYPGVGIPNSTGSAWGTSFAINGTALGFLDASQTWTGTLNNFTHTLSAVSLTDGTCVISTGNIAGCASITTNALTISGITGSIQCLQVSSSGVVSGAGATCGSGGGGGTVTSVSVTVPSTLLGISGSPITTSGTFAFSLVTQAANTVFGNFTSGSAPPTFSASPIFSAAGLTNIPACSTCMTESSPGPTIGAIPILKTAGTNIYEPSQIFIDTSVGKNMTSTGSVNFDTLISSANGESPAFSGSTIQFYSAGQASNGISAAIEDYSTALGAGEYFLLENGDVTTGLEIGHRSAGGASGGAGMNAPNANFIMSFLNSDIYIGPESSGGTFHVQGGKGGPNLLSASVTGLTQSGVYLNDMTTAGILATAGSGGNDEIILASTAQLTVTINGTACVIGGSCTISGGGSGTVTSIATTGPIGGGTITTTGTITCTTCVVASSPGLGLAHFAGATQTVTSSLVALGSDVSGNLPNANLASQTANTVLGALTATTPSGLTMPSCSTASSALTWTTGTGFGCNTISASPAGSTTQVQFNLASAFGASANFTWDNTNGRLLIGAPTSVASISLVGGTTAALGINFGDTFVNWYRFSAGVLKSDANVDINGALLMTGTGSISGAGSVSSAAYLTATNCASSASPAVCAAAPAGAFVIAAATTSVVVNTTKVTANSEIEITPDLSLSSRLSVTCNTTIATIINPIVTARSAGVSFTVTIPGTLVTNPACYTYSITN